MIKRTISNILIKCTKEIYFEENSKEIRNILLNKLTFELESQKNIGKISDFFIKFSDDIVSEINDNVFNYKVVFRQFKNSKWIGFSVHVPPTMV